MFTGTVVSSLKSRLLHESSVPTKSHHRYAVWPIAYAVWPIASTLAAAYIRFELDGY
jgi:hypothetical protein